MQIGAEESKQFFMGKTRFSCKNGIFFLISDHSDSNSADLLLDGEDYYSLEHPLHLGVRERYLELSKLLFELQKINNEQEILLCLTDGEIERTVELNNPFLFINEAVERARDKGCPNLLVKVTGHDKS